MSSLVTASGEAIENEAKNDSKPAETTNVETEKKLEPPKSLVSDSATTLTVVEKTIANEEKQLIVENAQPTEEKKEEISNEKKTKDVDNTEINEGDKNSSESKPNLANASDNTAGDTLFEPSLEMMVNDFDDERTLEEEEALAATESEDPTAELSNLERVCICFTGKRL